MAQVAKLQPIVALKSCVRRHHIDFEANVGILGVLQIFSALQAISTHTD